jgi:hypothetical protein
MIVESAEPRTHGSVPQTMRLIDVRIRDGGGSGAAPLRISGVAKRRADNYVVERVNYV